MSWDTIIGQDRIKHLLQRILLSGNIGSAYLFWGAPGVGADALAVEFGKVLNCISPIRSDSTFAACDQCRHCRQFAQLQHPNLHLLFPLPAGKRSKAETVWESLSEEQMANVHQALQQKVTDPYLPLEIPGAQSIKIQQIRELRKTLSLAPSVPGSRRIVLILAADTLTTEAANALLKTLEEPHPDTTILLTAERKDRLLPTILSRCQILRCEPLPEEAITEALQHRHHLSEDMARLLAHLAEGDYARAQAMITTDMEQLLELAIEFLRAALRPSQWGIHIAQQIEQVQSFDKSQQIAFLQILQRWLRLAWEASLTGTVDHLPPLFQRTPLAKFAQLYATADFPSVLTEIEHTISALQHNQQLALSIYHFVFRLRKLLLQKTDVS